MISSKEALERTKQVYLDRIETLIMEAIDRGETKCEIVPSQVNVSEENKALLKEKGFEVTESETMIGKEILIEWKNG